MRRFTTTILTATALITLATGCSDALKADSETRLEKAMTSCKDSADGAAFQLADGGDSIIINGAKSGDIPGLACVLMYLETPQSIVAEMDSTTAMMGRQSEEAHGVKYDWSYHPDNGIDMVITEN